MNTIKIILQILLSFFIITSCDKDDTVVVPHNTYETGFFVLNEGSFSNGNASLTYVSQDYTTVEQGVFQTVNEEGLGDVAQSAHVSGNNAYIVMNGSDKIVVVDKNTMSELATIEGPQINNPRYMVEYNGLGYVSNWGNGPDPSDDSIVIIDLATNTISSSISVGFVPDKMIVVGDLLYVILQGWAPNVNNKVEVIDLTTNTIVQNIEVGDYPSSIVYKDNLIYVLAGGSWGVSGGKISVINPQTNAVITTLEFANDENPSNLTYSTDGFYYNLNGKIYKWNGTADVLPILEEVGLDGFFYNTTISNGLLYATDAGDFSSEGSLKIFKLSDNSSVTTITTGIAPNGIIFL